jgi:hypothetical protein
MATNRGSFCFFLSVIICVSTGSAYAELCPSVDLNGDCRVDLQDVKLFTQQWLDSGECEGNVVCADFDGLNSINFIDFSILANSWLAQGVTLVINEFMASNNSASGYHDPAGDYDDWIEIYNFGDTPIDLAGMYLSDKPDNPTKWQFPSGYSSQTTVLAGGFVVIWADEESSEGPLHTNFKLSADGEDILLSDANENLIDSITFGPQTANISYERYPDAQNNWQFSSTATPGAHNIAVYLGEVNEVEFSHTRGFYSTSFNVTMACTTPGTTIYYTVNGSAPVVGEVNSPKSIRYTAPVAVNATKCLRAAAVKTGWRPSTTTTHTYIFGASAAIKAMPAISLVGDPNQTFYEPNGIMAIVGGYYDGNGVWQPSGSGSYNNVIHRGMAYERPVSFEIMSRTADGNYQMDCGIRIHGSDYTRPRFTRGEDWLCNLNKISFNLYFRSDYGDNRFEYPFFPWTPEVQHPQSICLRSGMNDRCSPFVKDEWMRRLFKEMGGVQETGTFANLYINGSYKYYYNPTGRADTQFYQEWYGTDNDFDIITQGGVRDGDSAAFDNLLNYIGSHDLSDADNYNYFDSKFDIQSFVDYLILQIYSANFDWPNNNFTVYRERSDTGKFRYSVWDAEGIEEWVIDDPQFGMDVNAFDDMPTYGSAPKGLNGLQWDYIPRFYRALKANPNFRQLWADRTHKFFHNGGVLTKDHLLARWYEVLGEVSAVLPAPPWDFYFIPNTFIPSREPYVLLAFEDNGLFTRAFGAPVFNVNGSYKFGGNVTTSDTFTITDPCASGGTIYYTIDGSDPRTPYFKTTTPTMLLVTENAAKKVKVPTADIGTTWQGGSEPYNDSNWTTGTGGVGYERDTGYEPYIDINVGSSMYNINGTCYIRIPFTLNAGDINNIHSLILRMRYDDGFAAYINATNVANRNAPGSLTWNSLATANAESYGTEDINISSYVSTLHTGTNILAIHGLNTSTGSSDFLITAELEVPGGATVVTEPNVSPAAIQYSGSFALNMSTDLKSRIYKSGTKQWSPLNEAVYEVGNLKNSLRITEIMYHPLDTNNPNDPNAEYVELKNISSSTINLNLVKFDKGIDFTFGPNTLMAGQHILVVKNQAAFEAKYSTGRYIAGQYAGSLDNAGERICFLDALGATILDFDYKDGWRSVTDGQGYSLTIINPANPDVNNWGRKDSWRSSAYINGSPGWDDSNIIPNPGAIVINEVLAHSHAEASDWIELYNTTASPVNLGGWYLSDSDTNTMKYKFASGTILPASGYLVVYEDTNFGPNSVDPGRLIPFALSENGDMVCLTSALDANSFLTGYREKENFGASETGVSFGRYYMASTNSYNFIPMDQNTPGQPNAYPKLGPIIFNEIMYNPNWPTSGIYANDEYEFIELYNATALPATLYDYNEGLPWKFTNGIDYTFPGEPNVVTIPSGSRILVVKNPTAFKWRYPSVPVGIIYGPYDGWLANDGGQLELGKPGDIDELSVRQYIRVERVNYSDGSHPADCPEGVDLWPTQADGGGKSLSRKVPTAYGNDPNNWQAAAPSPGAANP